jgi:hypothetical protein
MEVMKVGHSGHFHKYDLNKAPPERVYEKSYVFPLRALRVGLCEILCHCRQRLMNTKVVFLKPGLPHFRE